MKTVPSLVASSTIAVAAAGLALGKPERATAQHPSSKKRKVGEPTDVIIYNQGRPSPTPRPGTSCTVATPEHHASSSPSSNPPPNRTRPSSTRVEIPPNNSARRFSIIKHHEFFSPREFTGGEVRRESISSRGSWMKRLSTVPNSYNNSPRSSIGPDSPPLGSFAPIISPLGNSSSQFTPNKLVKRKTSERTVSGPEARSGSRSQVPTLRRPATSHQRAVTLQQQFRDDSLFVRDPVPSTPASHFIHMNTTSQSNAPDTRQAWRLYFESRPTKLSKERESGRSSDGGVQNFHSTSRRVVTDETVSPTLVKPGMILKQGSPNVVEDDEDIREFDDSNDEELDNIADATLPSTDPGAEVQKRARRSLSLQFSSRSTWIPRSGSLRGNKRSPDGRNGGKSYSSAPMPSGARRMSESAHGPIGTGNRPVLERKAFAGQPTSPLEADSSTNAFAENFHARSRNTSSPLPPLTRLSSFNVDLARLGLSSSSSSGPRRSPNSPDLQTNTTATSISSTGHASYFAVSNSKTPRTSEVADRASTLVGSDNDNKGFTSGDEDETDFRSETVFDSLRSGATGSMRSHNPPLDSMFDESPPSVNGNSKAKRLSIHEMLTNEGYHNGGILEEDEGMSTPVKGPHSTQGDNLRTPIRLNSIKGDDAFPSSPPSFCLATKDFSRLSLDDEDDDEDWTRDDDTLEINNPLSPPSNSLKARRVSPDVRAALAGALQGGPVNRSSGADRPKSNLFDWSEPSSIEKIDLNGNSTRPKTAHVKQNMDERGGRFVGRRGPSAAHIRSQSVPVVPEGNDKRGKLTPKFGTWGLGGKTISEDWDNDFEFESPVEEDAKAGDNAMEGSGMLVPPAIQASQQSVAGHVSQIREVCLLVEQLKKLRAIGKEKGLLNGNSAPLWVEAEGIITLAAASEDEEEKAIERPIVKASQEAEKFPDDIPDEFAESSSEEEDAESTDEEDEDEDGGEHQVKESVEKGEKLQVEHSEENPEGANSEEQLAEDTSIPRTPISDTFGEELPEKPKVYHQVGPMAKTLSRSNTPIRVLDRHGRPTGYVYDGKTTRRKSVFSPDDDIFGVPNTTPKREHLKPPNLTPRASSAKSSQDYARSLMETMHQQRAASDPLLQIITSQSPSNKLPFDTTSLRDLVQRASVLVRGLSDVIRKADGSESPEVSPHRDSSPAFTRVFTDPSASPPKHMPRSHSNNSVLSGSIEASPTRSLGQRMHMMTVV